MNQASHPANGARSSRNVALFILTLVYTFNFLDRQLVVILAEPIKNDLMLSDTQLGLLTGFSFALIYVSAGIPLAYLADRSNRRNILAVCLTIWSGMTALSGFAQNFLHLLLARVGVALGEAGGSPPSHSMISDLFPEEKRARALSIYSIGVPIGVMLGFLFGGLIAQQLGWRITFIVMGVPGILLAGLLCVLVKEPARPMSAAAKPTFKQTVQLLHSRPSFWLIAAGMSSIAFMGFAVGNFYPSFLIRAHDLEISQVGLIMALSAGIMGTMGSLISGYLGDKLGQRDKRWYLWLPALAMLLMTPFTAGSLLTSSLTAAALCIAMHSLFASSYMGCCFAIAHFIVPANMRAMSSAILFFATSIFGLGLGPLFTGILSDRLTSAGYEQGLRYAMLASVAFAFFAFAFFYWAASKVKTDLDTNKSMLNEPV